MAHKRNSVEVPELEKLLAGKKKKYVRYEEGAVLYSMGKKLFPASRTGCSCHRSAETHCTCERRSAGRIFGILS